MKTLYFVMSVMAVTFVATFVTTVQSSGAPVKDMEVTKEVYQLLIDMSHGCGVTEEMKAAMENDGKILESEAIELATICEARHGASPSDNPFEQGMEKERRTQQRNGGIRM